MKSIPYSAQEIFVMAEQIERNGARFYRRAAESTEMSGSRQFLLELAEMEDKHEQTFARMKSELGDHAEADLILDPDDQAAAYLQAMADGHVFDVRANPAELLTGSETMEEILKTAIGLEKDSIVFYLGMKQIVPENLGRDKIEWIITEEMRHVTILSKELAKLKDKLI